MDLQHIKNLSQMKKTNLHMSQKINSSRTLQERLNKDTLLKQLIQSISPQKPVKKVPSFLIISSFKLQVQQEKKGDTFGKQQRQNSQKIVRRRTEVCVSSKRFSLPSLSPQKVGIQKSQDISQEPDTKIVSVRKKSVRFYDKVECQAVEIQNGREYSVIKYLEPLNAE